MSPRQLSAFLEHGEALDRMQDARDLVVGILAGCGNEKEITKHLKAWSEGRSPEVKLKRKPLTDADMAKVRAMRDLVDRERAKKKAPNGS